MANKVCGAMLKQGKPKSLEQMNSHELEKDIVAMPFFKGMNDRHIGVLASCACRIHIEKGTIIFHQGETANRFYLIQDGTIELEAG